jgi:Homeodomain-like domain
VSVSTVRKWLGRYLTHGEAALRDRSSRPLLSPCAIAPTKALAIVELRRHRLTQARIATSLGVSKSTVGRVLAPVKTERCCAFGPFRLLLQEGPSVTPAAFSC